MPVVGTPRTWTPNLFVTDTILNAELRDYLNLLLSPPLCIVRQTVAQGITTAGTYQALTFTTEDYDNDGMHDVAINTNRITCQTAGRYLLAGGYTIAASATGRRGSCWYINGVAVNAGQAISTPGSSTVYESVARTMVVSLAVGDYVELRVYQDSGATLNTTVGTNAGAYAVVRYIGK